MFYKTIRYPNIDTYIHIMFDLNVCFSEKHQNIVSVFIPGSIYRVRLPVSWSPLSVQKVVTSLCLNRLIFINESRVFYYNSTVLIL